MYAAEHHGADATGITISKNQTAYGNARIAKAGLAERARIACHRLPRYPSSPVRPHLEPRDGGARRREESRRSSATSSYDLLKDDGLFLLQWTGIRRGGGLGVPVIGLRPEDLIWGLFMNKYIFSGADASLPLSDMAQALEKAGFEIHSAENVSIHYALTIKSWHENWQKNKAAVLKAYGERWYRLWHLFLAWSWRIAVQGTGQCFQVVAHKNLDSFNRRVFIGRSSLGSVRAPGKNGVDHTAIHAHNGTTPVG